MPTVSPAFTFAGVGTSLAKKSATASASISATLDSTAGVNNVAWSVAGTDETTTAGGYTLTPSGTKGETVTFTVGVAGTAGILSCTVNGGVDPQTGSPSTDMTASAKWYVPLADGGEVGCVNETTQSDSTFGSTGVVNGTARRLSGLGSTASLSAITVPAGASFTYSQAQHASGAGNPATLTAQAAATGAFNGGKWRFATGAAGQAAAHAGAFEIDLRAESSSDNKSGTFSLYNGGGSPFLSGYSISGAAVLVSPSSSISVLGATAATIQGGGASITLGAANIDFDGSTAITLRKNTALFANGSFGGGDKVIFIGNDSADPSTDPVGGYLLYAASGALKGRGSSGTVTTIGTADPHCPRCGNDYVLEWEHDARGHHLAICMTCLVTVIESLGGDVGRFAFINKKGK